MGISEIRMRDALLRLANGSDILTDAVNTSNTAWEENTALQEEADKRYATTQSQLTLLKNKLMEVAISAGEELLPAVNDLVDDFEPLIENLSDAVKWFASLDDSTKEAALQFAGFVIVGAPVLKTLAGITKAAGTLTSGIGGVVGGLGELIVKHKSAGKTASELSAAGAERSPESVRVSKAALRRLVYSLAPDRMLTLTYRENVTDYGQAKRDFKKFKDSFSKRFPGSCFVAVPEKQQRGAWHFHVALRGYASISTLRKWWPHGYARIDYRKRQLRADATKIGMYLSKYLGKDLGVLGRSAYSVCNRKVLDKPIKTVVRFVLGVSDGLPDWVKLESIFKHNALAAFAFNGVYWRLDHVKSTSP